MKTSRNIGSNWSNLTDVNFVKSVYLDKDRPGVLVDLFVSGKLPENGDIVLCMTLTQASKLVAQISAELNKHITEQEGEVL